MTRLGRFHEPSVEGLTQRLDISKEAAELFFLSDVIDLHLESYSFYRSFGYHPHRRHTGALTASHFCGHADLPRLLETGINGATWVITANPLRPESLREEAFERQLKELMHLIEEADDRAQLVRTRAEYVSAVQQGKHACFLCIQGANALPSRLDFLERHAPHLLRITLMHLFDSEFGATSTPSPRKLWGGSEGL
jgi:microsomal dipeptidase-like Zn-dependent dipeptidase